jgi:hypothetical protein
MHHLTATLKTLNRQTSKQFCIFVAGTDEPEIGGPEIGSSVAGCLEFLHCPDLADDDRPSKLRDMWNKRLRLAKRARELGGGDFMFVDADDLVSCRLVEFLEENPHPSGYLVTEGYVFDAMSGEIAPYPFSGYERQYPFDRICGTSAILRFSAEELPHDDSRTSLFSRIYKNDHPHVRRCAFDEGRPLARLPFRGVAYVRGTAENLSGTNPSEFGSRFYGELMQRLPLHVVERSAELESEFGLGLAEAAARTRSNRG